MLAASRPLEASPKVTAAKPHSGLGDIALEFVKGMAAFTLAPTYLFQGKCHILVETAIV